jgi:hypothetical protein
MSAIAASSATSRWRPGWDVGSALSAQSTKLQDGRMKITTLSQRQVQREMRESLAPLRADTPLFQQQVALAVDRERTVAGSDIPVTTHPRKTRYQATENCDLQEDDARSKLPVGALEAAENEGWCLPTPQPAVPRCS